MSSDSVAAAPQTPSTNTGTSFSTITTAVLVFVLLVAGIAAIAYILTQSLAISYPLSPFRFGDTITIRPAIPTGHGDEYLTQSGILRNPNGCLLEDTGYNYGTNAFAVTFNGKATDKQSRWVLKQFSTENFDANQTALSGFGNRFYIQNQNDPDDGTGRLRYQRLNESIGLCYNTTPAVIGSNGTETCTWFETDLLIYFYPTKYPNLYFMLFPSCSDGLLNTAGRNTTTQPNDGIISFRPWGDNNGQNNKKFVAGCNQCGDGLGTFNPWINGDPNQGLQPNVPIMNLITTVNMVSPFNDAHVKLFEVIKV